MILVCRFRRFLDSFKLYSDLMWLLVRIGGCSILWDILKALREARDSEKEQASVFGRIHIGRVIGRYCDHWGIDQLAFACCPSGPRGCSPNAMHEPHSAVGARMLEL